MRECTDWIDDFMLATDNSEPPLLFRKWTAVSVVAACLQRRCWAIWEKTIYPNLYVVLVGPPASRKGTAMNPGQELLRKEPTVRLASESITREALIKAMKEGNSTEATENGEYFQHTSITIYSQELAVFLGANNPQFLSDLTDWFDCPSDWSYETKHQGTFNLAGVWVNILGATTPELLMATLPQTAIGGGLTSRIVFVFGDTKHKLVPIPFRTPEEDALFKKLSADLSRISTLKGQFRMTEGFLKKRGEWYLQSEMRPPFDDHKFLGYCQRRPTHQLKLCMIMSASRDDQMVLDEEIFDRARELMEETEVLMLRTYGSYGRLQEAQVMGHLSRYIQAKKEVTFTQLHRTFINDITMKELMEMLRSLKRVGFINYHVIESGDDKGELVIRYIGEIK